MGRALTGAEERQIADALRQIREATGTLQTSARQLATTDIARPMRLVDEIRRATDTIAATLAETNR